MAERKELAALRQFFFLIASIPSFLTLLDRGGCLYWESILSIEILTHIGHVL